MRRLGWIVYQMEQEEPVSLRDGIAVEPHRLLSLPGRPPLITCSFHCKGAWEGEGGGALLRCVPLMGCGEGHLQLQRPPE